MTLLLITTHNAKIAFLGIATKNITTTIDGGFLNYNE
jgi:hypothetical protein